MQQIRLIIVVLSVIIITIIINFTQTVENFSNNFQQKDWKFLPFMTFWDRRQSPLDSEEYVP